MKLTPLQRRRTLYRLADLYQKAQREHPTETPAQHHARAFAWIGCEQDFANHAARMRLNQADRLAKWTNEQASPKTWKKPKNGRPFTLPEFPGLDSAPKGRTPTVRVVGQIDGHGQTFQASPNALPDGANVLQLTNAKVNGTSPPAIVLDPLQAGPQPGAAVDYTGEPTLRAALVDALRERRRGRELRNQDAGELDLSRIAPTALGLDLDRAFARRIRPDVRGVAVLVLVDASSSMRKDGRGVAAKRGACLAYRALTRERIAVSVAQYGAREETSDPAFAVVAAFGAPQSQAMADLHDMPEWRFVWTLAPRATERAAEILARRSEPRRVLMFLCDEDVTADDPAWKAARAAGLELWPILLGVQAAAGREKIDAAGWSSIPPIVAEDPAELVPTWTRAMRAHLGRVAV